MDDHITDPDFAIEATETHNGNMVELWFAKNEEKIER